MSDIRVAFVMATWHDDLVDRTKLGFFERMAELGHGEDCIDVHKLPGALEFPLHCKKLAETGNYDVIVTAALVVDGGIYRHDFVASTVLDAMMQVQLETETPILSVVLTPHHFQECEAHENFFFEHFKIKGAEAAVACAKTLKNLEFTMGGSKAA